MQKQQRTFSIDKYNTSDDIRHVWENVNIREKLIEEHKLKAHTETFMTYKRYVKLWDTAGKKVSEKHRIQACVRLS